MARSLEIRSNYPWPSCALSNFAKWPFEMDGNKFGGLEGFLQGCKVKNREHQQRIFRLSGLAAHDAGRGFASKSTEGTLFYNGCPFSRHSLYWKNLYTCAYITCALQNAGFRDALRESKGRELRHSMASGYTEEETILTEQEFISVLNHVRNLI